MEYVSCDLNFVDSKKAKPKKERENFRLLQILDFIRQ